MTKLTDYGYDPEFLIDDKFDRVLAEIDYSDDFEPIFDQDGAGFEEICNLTDQKIIKKIQETDISFV